MELEQIRQIKQQHENELFAKQNVIGVGIGFKQVAGEKTDEISIVADVIRKVPESELAEQDIIPKEVDGVKTDVIETGRINIVIYNPIDRFRPAPGGISIGHKDITAGTLGISTLYPTTPPDDTISYGLIFEFE